MCSWLAAVNTSTVQKLNFEMQFIGGCSGDYNSQPSAKIRTKLEMAYQKIL